MPTPESIAVKNFRSLSRVELEELYHGRLMTTRQIAEFYGISSPVVVWKLRDDGIKCRRRHIKMCSDDERRASMFRSWSDDVAYILGYIWADGSISCHSETRAIVQFRCKRSDKCILEYLKSFLGSDNKISDYNVHLNEKAFQASCLTISGPRWVSVLMDLHGIMPRKSFTNPEYPFVDDEYFWSFFRGVFDGDGSMTEKINGAGVFYSYSIVGGHRFLDGLSRQASRLLNTRHQEPINHGGHSLISWHSKSDVSSINRAMYRNPCGFHLSRKRKIKNSSDLETYRMLDEAGTRNMWLQHAEGVR